MIPKKKPMAVDRKTWMNAFITPQTLVMVGAGIVAIVMFWFKTQENWNKTTKLEEKIDKVLILLEDKKADKSDLKSTDDRVNRQYETSKGLDSRVNALEKNTEYQRGKTDGIKESKQ